MSASSRGHTGPRGSVGAELLQPQAVNEEKYFLVYALVSSSQTRSRLLSLHRLLSSVVQAARGVVKGTDSQRKFNAEFAQFCRTALVGLADLEDATFELKNPGRRAADAADDEVVGIAELDFMKEVAAFVASQTPSLTAQYLEHVATSAVGKTMKQQQEGVQATAETASSRLLRKRPRERSGATNGALGGGSKASASVTPVKALGVATSLEEQELGLLDERELVARAALLSSGGHEKKAEDPPSGSSPPHAPHPVADKVPQEGVFFSSDGHAYDLRRAQTRLTAIEELRLRLEPWKMPQLYGAIELERVTAEREKRPVGASSANISNSKDTGNNHGGSAAAVPAVDDENFIPLLDVCLSATPAELLRSWENREAALAAMSTAAPGPSLHSFPHQTAGGKRGSRRHGTSPHAVAQTQHPPQNQRSPPLPNAPSQPLPDPQLPLGRSITTTTTATTAAGELPTEPHQDFFPSVGVRMTASVPAWVMRDLVHNGVSSIEYLYS